MITVEEFTDRVDDWRGDYQADLAARIEREKELRALCVLAGFTVYFQDDGRHLELYDEQGLLAFKCSGEDLAELLAPEPPDDAPFSLFEQIRMQPVPGCAGPPPVLVFTVRQPG